MPGLHHFSAIVIGLTLAACSNHRLEAHRVPADTAIASSAEPSVVAPGEWRVGAVTREHTITTRAVATCVAVAGRSDDGKIGFLAHLLFYDRDFERSTRDADGILTKIAESIAQKPHDSNGPPQFSIKIVGGGFGARAFGEHLEKTVRRDFSGHRLERVDLGRDVIWGVDVRGETIQLTEQPAAGLSR